MLGMLGTLIHLSCRDCGAIHHLDKDQLRHEQVYCARCDWELGDDCELDQETGELICAKCANPEEKCNAADC
jgi:hypothetical protein